MTRNCCWLLSLGVACAIAHGAGGAELVLFAPSMDDANVKSLSETLSPGKPDGVQIADSLENALRSDANLLVLFAGRKSLPSINEVITQRLRQKKVIGIGYGAAEIFGKLGLEINGGACAHNPLTLAPQIDLQSNQLRSSVAGKALVAYQVPSQEKPDEAVLTDYNFAMYLPPKSEKTRFVEAIARWQGDGNYAPIVRQGSYLMVGLAAPPSTWTKEYQAFFRELTVALAAVPKEPFSRAQFEITQPGEYEFELAQGRSTTELSVREFYFQFKNPGQFTAELSHHGSASVMLLFRGENDELYTRQDAGSGETLAIKSAISARNIRSVGSGHWRLEISNFDPSNRAICKLKIGYKEDGVAEKVVAGDTPLQSSAPGPVVHPVRPADTVRFIRAQTSAGDLKLKIDDPRIETLVTENGVTVRDLATKREYDLTVRPERNRTAEPTINVAESPDGLQFETNQFNITRGKKIALQVTAFKDSAEKLTNRAEQRAESQPGRSFTELALFLGCGPLLGPAAIHQVSMTGEIIGTIPVAEPPDGLVRRKDGLVAVNASPREGGGQSLVIRPDGTIDRLTLKEEFPAPIAMAIDYKSQDLIVADNEQNTVYRVPANNSGEVELLFRAPLTANHKHYPSMSVAAVGDGHVVFSASDPKGVFWLPLGNNQTLPEPFLPDDVAVAADPTSQQWVLMQRDRLKVFGGLVEKRSIPCPAGSMFCQYRVMTFAPDGKLFVVLQTGKGFEVQSVDLHSGEFAPHFVWSGEGIRSMAVGTRLDWKR